MARWHRAETKESGYSMQTRTPRSARRRREGGKERGVEEGSRADTVVGERNQRRSGVSQGINDVTDNNMLCGTYLCYQFSAREFELDLERVWFFILLLFGLFFSVFGLHFSLGGATATALKLEAAVDGNTGGADQVASLQARLDIRELEKYICMCCYK